MNKKLLKPFVFILFIGMFSAVQEVQAQQDAQFTQYMYNTVSVNPAYAGSRGSLSMIGLYRNQWVGLDGAPKTLNFSANSPIGVNGIGLGLGFTSDKIGPSTENMISADFSYTIAVSENTELAFGVKGGLSLLDLNPNKLLIYDPNDYDLTQKSYSSPTIGAGLYLYSQNWYLGLSTPNFLETNYYDDVQVSTATEKMHIYFIGGYVFELNQDLKLKPALLAKAVVGAPLAIDLSANALLYDRVTLGLAYRFDAAVSGLAGFQVNDNILIGYSYDYDTTPFSRYNNGSHEIFLRFELGNRQRSKMSPRFF